MDADVVGPAAARVGGLEQQTQRHVPKGMNVVDLNVAKTSGGLAAKGDSRCAVAHRGVAYDDVLIGARNPQAIGVAARFQAERIVVVGDVCVFYQHVL